MAVSLGVARADHGTESAEQVLRDADAAAVRARAAGRNRIVVHDSRRAGAMATAEQMERALRRALERDELSVVYQPIAQVRDGRLVGFEALLRWTHADGTAVPPNTFLPVAERSGLIVGIGEWVLDVACRDASSWQAARGTDLSVHVNVSAAQLESALLPQMVERVLHQHGLPPGVLTLEVTEEMLVDDPELARERLAHLHAVGVHLAIDDFGTGHTSLAEMRTYPLRMLKIDREFVKGMPHSSQDRRIVQAIIELAHGMGHTVVAEGVEHDEELVHLQEMGCDMAQGWLFGQSLSPAEALLVAAAATSRTL
jgi:EAL domain-containing protein (putative c-di-GMP-specific phosphodiesterase class I)